MAQTKPLTFKAGGRLGGSVCGPQKRRSPAHYFFIGKLRARTAKLGRKLTERERAKFKADCFAEYDSRKG